MEILHTDAKRTVIAALDDSKDGDVYSAHLANEFNVVRVNSAEKCLAVMYERTADLSAVICDIEMAEADDFAFLKIVANERAFDTIPVLIASRRQINESDMRCLDEGAFDFILPPHHLGLTKRRVDNAVRMKRATTFFEIESILRQLPSNIFLKDTRGRYVFMTHYWHHLDRGDDPNWTIRGKTDIEIRRDKENAELAMQSDREIVRTGKGTSYVIESNVDGVHDFKELIKEPVFDENGNVTGIIALINDVTETEMLRRELERRMNTDELTGLGNRRAYNNYLNSIPLSDNFPIAIISADCDRLKYVNDTFGHLVGDEYIRTSAKIFESNLPDTAQVFRMSGDEFLAFLPGQTQAQAEEFVSNMRVQGEATHIQDISVSISYGTAEISGPEVNANATVMRADHAMYRDKAQRKMARSD